MNFERIIELKMDNYKTLTETQVPV